MNYTIDRESVAMKAFSSQAGYIADELDSVVSHLRQMLYQAEGHMKDESAQRALAIVEELVEETVVGVSIIRSTAEMIQKSADLLEQSDELL